MCAEPRTAMAFSVSYKHSGTADEFWYGPWGYLASGFTWDDAEFAVPRLKAARPDDLTMEIDAVK